MKKCLLALLLLQWLSTALALPMTASNASGHRGDQVSLTLGEQASSFDVVELYVNYDPTALSYVGAVEGTLGLPVSIVDDASTAGRTWISLVSGNPPSGQDGSLLTVFFDILAGAPFGDTAVSFVPAPEMRDPALSPLYPFDSVAGTVTVLGSGGAAPEPGSLAGVAVALLSLAVVKRAGRGNRPRRP